MLEFGFGEGREGRCALTSPHHLHSNSVTAADPMASTLAPDSDLEALGVSEEIEVGLAKVGGCLLVMGILQIDKLNGAWAHNSVGNPFVHDRGKP